MNSKFFDNINVFIEWIENQKRLSKKTSLDKMKYLMNLFDHPESKFKSIHITGTNGKGSTVAYLKNIYLSAGYNVATYTSPYVTEFNERIAYNNKNISDEDLLLLGNEIITKYSKLEEDNIEPPTFFEFITLMAFIYFSRISDLDIAIIEVGMGGRLDATNVITPLVSAITNVTLEHQHILGDTLEQIATEKLGILKENSCLITSEKNSDLLFLMEETAKNKCSKLIKVDFEQLKIKTKTLDESIFSYKDYNDITVKLLGEHQIENALLAIEIVEYCNYLSLNKKSNLYVSDVLLYRGLNNTTWPGRFEKISSSPLIYIDGGHNIDCIRRISNFVNELDFNQKCAVVAISNDKDKLEMIKILDKTFDILIFTHYSYKRSAKSSEIYELSNCKNKLLMDELSDAIRYVYNKKYDFTLFIGSLYLISEVRKKLKKD